ncbi:hypothetical protein D3C81_2158890 [compost metagenome]
MRGAFRILIAARNHAHGTCSIWQVDGGNNVAADALITRHGHFVFGWQVDPQLDHFQLAALTGKFRRMKFFV